MIPEEEWLDRAKRLAVGMRMRVRHRNESRVNMVIANEADRWWCYCQRCHDGGVVKKEHVMLGATVGVVEPTVVPTDLYVPAPDSFEMLTIAKFLASKNMDLKYFPLGVMYSPSRRRIMLNVNGHTHGRDITGKSPQKWMNYSNVSTIGTSCGHAVIVEDLFSWHKVQYAVGANADAVCALGTQAKYALMLSILNATRIDWFMDADAAGDEGASKGMQRMRVHTSAVQRRVRPPEGKDPKDMTIAEIRSAILGESYA